MDLVYKVYAYITHGKKLLVFDHVDFPEEAPQVPGGTCAIDESPEDAVLREAWEETGLEGLTLNAFLGEIDFALPSANAVYRRRFYHLVCNDAPIPRWRHYEEDPSDGSPEPILFELYWLDLPEGLPGLAPGHDAFIPALLARIGIS